MHPTAHHSPLSMSPSPPSLRPNPTACASAFAAPQNSPSPPPPPLPQLPSPIPLAPCPQFWLQLSQFPKYSSPKSKIFFSIWSKLILLLTPKSSPQFVTSGAAWSVRWDRCFSPPLGTAPVATWTPHSRWSRRGWPSGWIYTVVCWWLGFCSVGSRTFHGTGNRCRQFGTCAIPIWIFSGISFRRCSILWMSAPCWRLRFWVRLVQFWIIVGECIDEIAEWGFSHFNWGMYWIKSTGIVILLSSYAYVGWFLVEDIPILVLGQTCYIHSLQQWLLNEMTVEWDFYIFLIDIFSSILITCHAIYFVEFDEHRPVWFCYCLVLIFNVWCSYTYFAGRDISAD